MCGWTLVSHHLEWVLLHAASLSVTRHFNGDPDVNVKFTHADLTDTLTQ